MIPWKQLRRFWSDGFVELCTPETDTPALRTVLFTDGHANCFVDSNQLNETLTATHLGKVRQYQATLQQQATRLRQVLQHGAKVIGTITFVVVVPSTEQWEHMLAWSVVIPAGSYALHRLFALMLQRPLNKIMNR